MALTAINTAGPALSQGTERFGDAERYVRPKPSLEERVAAWSETSGAAVLLANPNRRLGRRWPWQTDQHDRASSSAHLPADGDGAQLVRAAVLAAALDRPPNRPVH